MVLSTNNPRRRDEGSSRGTTLICYHVASEGAKLHRSVNGAHRERSSRPAQERPSL